MVFITENYKSKQQQVVEAGSWFEHIVIKWESNKHIEKGFTKSDISNFPLLLITVSVGYGTFWLESMKWCEKWILTPDRMLLNVSNVYFSSAIHLLYLNLSPISRQKKKNKQIHAASCLWPSAWMKLSLSSLQCWFLVRRNKNTKRECVHEFRKEIYEAMKLGQYSCIEECITEITTS